MRYKFDENNIYIETVNDDDSENTTDIRPQDGLYKAKFTGTEWVETLTQAEIDIINYIPPKEKTELEILQEENEALKIRVVETEKTVASNSNDQQQLLELLIGLQVI